MNGDDLERMKSSYYSNSNYSDTCGSIYCSSVLIYKKLFDWYKQNFYQKTHVPMKFYGHNYR